MKSKRNARAALVAVVLAALGVAPAASGARAQVAGSTLWCPEGLPIQCQRTNERPRFDPAQVRPKIVPALTRNAYGRQAFRSGGWMME